VGGTLSPKLHKYFFFLKGNLKTTRWRCRKRLETRSSRGAPACARPRGKSQPLAAGIAFRFENKSRLGWLSPAGYRDAESVRENFGGELGETFCAGERAEAGTASGSDRRRGEPLPGAAGNSNGVSSGSSLPRRPGIKGKNPKLQLIDIYKPANKEGKDTSSPLGPTWTRLGDTGRSRVAIKSEPRRRGAAPPQIC